MTSCKWCHQEFRRNIQKGEKELLCEKCWAKAGEDTRKKYKRIDAIDFNWDDHDWGWKDPEGEEE